MTVQLRTRITSILRHVGGKAQPKADPEQGNCWTPAHPMNFPCKNKRHCNLEAIFRGLGRISHWQTQVFVPNLESLPGKSGKDLSKEGALGDPKALPLQGQHKTLNPKP